VRYSIVILPRAKRGMAALPPAAYERMRQALLALADNPRPQGCIKMVSRAGWRLREGDYRVIYEINDKDQIVTILHVGHRRDVYR
jgi:mRNA interferase RelE/StbE